ncbi:hypothetical protein [Novosphingobium sp. ST904]|uniref:hypothetical protein n=1 Tax=Novosphingobium sp. ST904 TaxID=1684385 RepID=UPI0006C885A0|nr:hypothetical protein [Novosphingobium sp. ST904]KPH66090.1 hypothetical protein ADT71_08400 [Novosphingobium sp. ST904]TCM27783.1 hypothetical protein EDF59_13145 [Novosphingobium sp. ST904]
MNEVVVEQGCYVVFIGSFNPAIFTPHWLEREGLISRSEADAAEIEIVHRDLARFALPGMKFEMVQERFQVFAEAEPFVRLVDIIGQLFIEKMPHIPVKSVGINYFVHADLTDWKKRLRFGRTIAPLEPWGSFAASFADDYSDQTGGMIDLTMQAPRPDDLPGVVRVTLQPSNKIPENTGIFIQVNDSFEIERRETQAPLQTREGNKKSKREKKVEAAETAQPERSSADFGALFVDNFEASIDRSRAIVSELVELAVKS